MAFSLDKRERERERVNPHPLPIKQHFLHKISTLKHETQNSSKIQILPHKIQNSRKIQILPTDKTDKTPKIPTPKPPPQGRGLLRLLPLSHSKGLFKGQILSHKIQNSRHKAYKAFYKALNFVQILKKFTQITHCKRFA